MILILGSIQINKSGFPKPIIYETKNVIMFEKILQSSFEYESYSNLEQYLTKSFSRFEDDTSEVLIDFGKFVWLQVEKEGYTESVIEYVFFNLEKGISELQCPCNLKSRVDVYVGILCFISNDR